MRGEPCSVALSESGNACNRFTRPHSALGHSRRFLRVLAASAYPPKLTLRADGRILGHIYIAHNGAMQMNAEIVVRFYATLEATRIRQLLHSRRATAPFPSLLGGLELIHRLRHGPMSMVGPSGQLA